MVEAVADSLEEHGRPTLVVDPVLVSTSGDTLAGKDCIEAILHRCTLNSLSFVHAAAISMFYDIMWASVSSSGFS